MLEWSMIVEAGIKAAAPKIIDAAIGAASREFAKKQPYKSLNFEKHLERSMAKCMTMKTVFSGNRGVDFLNNYVPPTFSLNKNAFDEYDFIEEIWRLKKVGLVGPAGSGKSMFLRYFWIACTVEPRGKIPIFVELRDFDIEENRNIFELLHEYCCKSTDDGSKNLFLDAINEGQFAFILDGLDEIKPKQRKAIEKSLFELLGTKNVVLISSRPSVTLSASQEAHIFEVNDFDIDRAIKLIQTIDFDSVVKDKFVKSLTEDMFEKHRSFAARPLLLSLMLLTYNLYADVPSKMHLFYDQAFDVLFSRHDALKEIYRRDKRCSLQIDRFKSVFSAFCLLTYNDSKFEFSESEMLEYIKRAAKICSDDFRHEDFMDDLLDAVNVMHRDGLKFVFSHRSFQEYFSAYCILRLDEQKAGQIIAKISEKDSDDVLEMLYDMNKNFFQRLFLDPYLTEYQQKTMYRGKFSLIKYIKSLDARVLLSKITRKNKMQNGSVEDNEQEAGLAPAIFFTIDGQSAAINARSFVGRNCTDAQDYQNISQEFVRFDLCIDDCICDKFDRLVESFGVSANESDHISLFFDGSFAQVIATGEDVSSSVIARFDLDEHKISKVMLVDLIESSDFAKMASTKRKLIIAKHREIKKQIENNRKSIEQIIG